MKRAFYRCSLVWFCLCFVLVNLGKAQTYPVVVSILPSPPFSLNIDDYLQYENQDLLTLFNSGTQEVNLTLYGIFKSDNGTQIIFDESNKPVTPIRLSPGESKSYSPVELSQLYPGVDLGNIQMNSRTESMIQQVMLNRSIPEGTYQICVRAHDFYTGVPLSDSEPFGCSQDITISYLDPPVIISPQNGEKIPSDNIQLIPFSWTDASLSLDRTYKLEIIDLSEIGNINVNQAFETQGIPRFFERDDISVTTYMYSFNDPILIPGNSYAIRVTANDPTGTTQYRLDGKSNIVEFTYGGCNGNQTHILLNEEYPLAGDTLPFSGIDIQKGGHIPHMVQFGPYCESYRGFVFKLTVEGDDLPPYVRDEENQWPNGGPLGYLNRLLQQNGLPPATEAEAQVLPLAVKEDRIAKGLIYYRGKTYRWRVNAQMRVGQVQIPVNLPNKEVTIGMTKPIPLMPEKGDVVEPGDIDLSWKGGNHPKKIFPTYLRNHRMQGNQILNRQETAAAWEKGQLQVSDNAEFTKIIAKHSFELGGSSYKWPNMSEEDILEEMYGERKHTIQVSEPGTYYWRIVYLSDPSDGNSVPYLTGPASTFVIEQEEPTDPCQGTCSAGAVENQEPISDLKVGDLVQIGKFSLEIKELNSKGGQYSGKGLILIPWLNHSKLRVKFDKIRVNTDLVVFEGQATGVEERLPLTLEEVAGPVGNILAPVLGDKGKLNEILEEGRAVSDLARSQEITLPIGLDKTIEGHKFLIGIINMTFTPSGAKLNAAAEIDFKASWNVYTPGFGADDVCFHPYGLEDVATLYLKKSFYMMDRNWKLYLEMLGADKASNEKEITKLEWDCDGYKCLQINGQVIFDRKVMVPADQNGKPTQGQVKVNIRGQQCRGNNWMLDLNMDPFQIPGAPGFTFTAQEATLDLSDLENPENLTLPDIYETSIDMEDPDQAKTWKGFYLKTLQMQAPSDFMMGSNAKAGVYNMIIDKSGFTADFKVQNLVPLDKGNFHGWGVSIDLFEISILQNKFIHGKLDGRVDLPISKDGDALDFTALLSNNNRKLGFTSRIKPRDEISIDLMAAKLSVDPTSYFDIKIGAQEGQQTRTDYAELNLQGSLTISDKNLSEAVKLASNFIPSLQLTGLHGHLTYSTDQGFTKAHLSKASPQKFLSGFPLTIHSINLRHSEQEVRLEIEPLISLTGGNTAISAKTKISLNSELNLLGSNKREKFKLKGISFDGIWIDATISEFGLKGSLEFYKNGHQEGAKGNLQVSLPLNLGLQTNVEFGVVRKNKIARYNTSDYFSYWFVDGMVSIPYGIPIAKGYAIYGFGGGAYHHMRVNPTSLPKPEKTYRSSGKRESPESSGTKYIPDFNTGFGFNVAAVTGSYPTKELLNIKGQIGAEFNRSGGLNKIIVQGDLAVMSNPASGKSSKTLWGSALVVYQRTGNNPRLDGIIDLFFDAKNIEGSGPNKLMINAAFHASPIKWYFHAGNYHNRGGIRVKHPFKISMESYLMLGHDIPDYLPQPAGFLGELFSSPKIGSGKGRVTFENSTVPKNRDSYDQVTFKEGNGFAFGLAFESKMGVDVKVIKAELAGIVGGDIKVVNSSQCKGINGWQGAGQAYAGLRGGFYVDLPAVGKHKIVDLKAGAMLIGNAPDPIGFEGKAKVKVTLFLFSKTIGFKVRVGKMCGV